MRNEEFKGNKVVMFGMIQACENIRGTRMDLSVHEYMTRRYTAMDVVIETSLMKMYAKNGRLDKCTQTVDRNAKFWIQTKYCVDCGALLLCSKLVF